MNRNGRRDVPLATTSRLYFLAGTPHSSGVLPVDRPARFQHFTNFADAAGEIKVEEWVKLAHEYKIPAFIDAAADTPPVSHLSDYANMGYDLIAFSGGKAIRGP